MSHQISQFKKRLLEKEIIIMDGGTGTEIMRRGVKTTLPLWSAGPLLTHPNVVKQIHRDYITAGAEIIITDTFRTTKRTLAKANMAERAKELTLLACQLAHEAISETNTHKKVLIAGSIAPLEDCYTPGLVPSDEQLQKEHLEHAQNLKAGGVDFLLVETMNTIKEAVFALKSAKEVGLPIAISFCCSEKGNLLSGESIKVAVEAIESFDPLFISVNCVSGETATAVLEEMRQLTHIPLGAYANGEGCPHDDEGWIFNKNMNEADYLKFAKAWVTVGAQIIGGCCGTSPEYIALLATSLPKRIA